MGKRKMKLLKITVDIRYLIYFNCNVYVLHDTSYTHTHTHAHTTHIYTQDDVFLHIHKKDLFIQYSRKLENGGNKQSQNNPRFVINNYYEKKNYTKVRERKHEGR